ncbi:hypothetical protein AB3480_30735 [Rhizobium mongolense]|uniref:hypothetical protein n=1 Tax=Rhizobium mongolense TaxID=57676 RepID=UPI0034A0FAE2
MDRRSFIVAASLMLMWPPRTSTAQSGPAEDWQVFGKLAAIFTSILQATDPIADLITKARFVRLLQQMDGSINTILNTKRNILSSIMAATCSDGNSLEAALRATAGLTADLNTLAAQIETLSVCVKPPEARKAAEDAGDELYSLMTTRKIWIGRIPSYCGMDTNAKSELRSEIQTSIDIVAKSRDALGSLIDRLRE